MDEFKIGPTKFAGLVSSYHLSSALFGLIFSAIIDRFERKKFLIFSLIGFIFALLSCSLAQTAGHLLFSRGLAGLFGGLLNVIILTLVTDLVPMNKRGKAIGAIMSSFSVASVIGIPLGLVLSESMGLPSIFLFIAFLALLLIFTSIAVLPRVEVKSESKHEKKISQNLTELGLDVSTNYLKILRHKDYIISFGLIFFVGMSIFLLIPFLSPFAVKNMGIEVSQIKYMYMIAGALTVMTARIFGVMTDRFGPLKMYSILGAFSALPILLYTNSGTSTLLFYILVGALFMSLVSGRMIPCMTYFSQIPTPEDRGAFMGLLNSIKAFGQAIGIFLSGLYIKENMEGELTGVNHVGFFSVFLIMMTVLGLLLFSKIREPSQPPQASF